MDNLIRVKDNSVLARNKQSGAIVNINKKSIADARIAKFNRLEEQKRIKKLENDISEIKLLLQKLVNKNV